MNYRDPELRDRLASEYAIGTLSGLARQRFESLMRDDQELADLVQTWQERLQPLADAVPPMAPSEHLLRNIEQRLGFELSTSELSTPAPARAAVSAVAPSSPAPAAANSRKRQAEPTPVPGFWQRLFAPIPVGALAMGLALGMIVPRMLVMLSGETAQQALLPASYVGVLADANGRHGMAISSLRHGRSVDVKQLQAVEIAPGQVLYLWGIHKSGAARPIAPLPNQKFATATLPDTSERLFADIVELAVSAEPIGQTPSQPSGAFLFRGLCGKFWR
jgi:anti-sigma-K factor RskA